MWKKTDHISCNQADLSRVCGYDDVSYKEVIAGLYAAIECRLTYNVVYIN